MNTDDLISKYLDGDLSDSEDALLRKLMSSDQNIKDDFDDSIFMHYALKDDAKNLNIPESLRINTQDYVLMRILNDMPTNLKLQKRRQVAYRLSYAVAAVLLFGFALISEFPALKHYNKLYSYQAKESQANELLAMQGVSQTPNSSEITKRSVNNLPNSNSPLINDGIANTINGMKIAKDAFRLLAPSASDSESSSEVIAELTTNPVEANRSIDPAPTPTNEIISFGKESSNNYIEDTESVNNYRAKTSNSFTNRLDSPSEVQFSEDSKEASLEHYLNAHQFSPGIELTTSFGDNIANNVFDDDASSLSLGLSQSLGYRIAERHKIGFEFGYMNFSSVETRFITLPINAKVDGFNPNDPTPTIKVPVKSRNESRTIWSTVFYEYRLLDYNWFTLDSRLGLGGSKDGLLNLGRLNAAFNVLNSVQLIVGIDGRMFYTDIPKTIPGEAKLRSSLSLIYGIQFNL